ncbi:GumC family protein [Solimonas soli]|uniref:GumC family protein n=1 Tax=Solimonas soli TaxID=413479 RepID=UPI000485EE04|nr:GumC family protein [Solimonas soli]
MSNQLPALNVSQSVASMPPLVPLTYVHPGLSLAQLLAILRAHRRRIAVIFTAVLGLALAAALLLPRTYEADATLLVRYEVNDPLGGKEFPLGLLGGYIATQVEILQGPSVLLPVIETLGLTRQRDYTAGFKGAAQDLPSWVMERMRKRLEVRQGPAGSQLIHIQYSADSPDEAARIANAIADTYVSHQNARLTEPAAAHATRYAGQLTELRDKADAAQRALSAFRDAHTLIDVQPEMAALDALEQRLREAEDARRVAETRARGDVQTGAAVMSSTLVQSMKTQLGLLLTRRAELRTTLGPRHPDILALDAQIAEAKRTLAAEVGGYARGAAADLDAARSLEAKLRKAVDDQRTRTLQIRELQDQAARLEIEVASAQAVYKRALDGYDQVAFASQSPYNNIGIESRASKPLRPASSRGLKLAVLGVGLGAALGVGLSLVLELLRRRVRCRDDIERDHGIPVLMEFAALPSSGSRP